MSIWSEIWQDELIQLRFEWKTTMTHHFLDSPPTPPPVLRNRGIDSLSLRPRVKGQLKSGLLKEAKITKAEANII